MTPVEQCRRDLMDAALHGDADRMVELHARLDHLTCLRRLTQPTGSHDAVEQEQASG